MLSLVCHARSVLAVATALMLVLSFEAAGQVTSSGGPNRSVTINSEPNAKVWINGVLYGRTSESGSLTINTVSPGRKTIQVRAAGFKQATRTLLPAERGPVSVPLVKTSDEAELAFQQADHLASVDRDKAIQTYQRAIKLRPSFVEAQIGLARVALDAGDFELAIKALAAARRLQPRSAEISAIEGRILKSVDEETKAIAAFKRSIREGNGFQPEAYAGLGLLYKERAENAGAAGEYERESADYAEAARNLAMAIKQLAGAPDAVVLYQFLGLVYEQQKKPALAIAVYEEFIKYFPGHPESEAFQSFIVQLKKQSDPK